MVTTHTLLRLARPAIDLQRTARFYIEGLGLSVLESFENHEGFDGVMLGIPGAPYHLEFTRRNGGPAGRAATGDHLLVFYLPNVVDWQAAVDRMRRAGHHPVPASNPYWNRHALTFEDPDGSHVVLANASGLP
jgi:catechol 2,3-dioxygenase-like lactoylglutathione lyase family enzyme